MHMRVVRTAAKTFPTYHWNGGEWTAGWPEKVVPYRLPELLAVSADTVVLICEGEKDADTATRYGFVATTNPGGAGKWQLELTDYFKDKQRVCLMQDNDEAGAKHTAKVLNALRNIVPAIGVVTFPELAAGGDLSDYFAHGGSKPYLITRIEQALKQGTARPYVLTDLDGEPEADDWLWEGYLPLGALELMTGIPGVGKSLVQCDLIATITTGRPWPDGSPGPQPGNVIILTAEDRIADYKRRLAAAGANRSKVKILSYIRRNNRNELFLLAEDLDKLEQAIRDLGDVRLVAIDPITAFMGHGRGFDSHRATDVRSQLFPLKQLAEKLGVAFSAVTHPPKNAGVRIAIDSFIGSQAFVAASRAAHYCIAEMSDEDDRGHCRPTGRVLFTNVRTSHSAPVPTLAYHIEQVNIGWDRKRERNILVPRIVWAREPIDITADEARRMNQTVSNDGRKTRNVPIKEFIRDMLIAAGAPVLQKIIVERGALRGFSYDQLWRARKAVGAIAFKHRGANLSSPWLWAMPEHVPTDAELKEDK
jgi:AAA domain